MSQLSCSSFTAGIVEAVLDGLSFVTIMLLILSSQLTVSQACQSYRSQYAQFSIPEQDHNLDQVGESRVGTRGAAEIIMTL
jgi:hypothetical protein